MYLLLKQGFYYVCASLFSSTCVSQNGHRKSVCLGVGLFFFTYWATFCGAHILSRPVALMGTNTGPIVAKWHVIELIELNWISVWLRFDLGIKLIWKLNKSLQFLSNSCTNLCLYMCVFVCVPFSLMHYSWMQEMAYLAMTCVSVFLLLQSGAWEIHVPSGPEPGDGTQRPADSQQIPAYPGQGSVSQKPTTKHQGTDSSLEIIWCR